jgi:hypothetical protein
LKSSAVSGSIEDVEIPLLIPFTFVSEMVFLATTRMDPVTALAAPDHLLTSQVLGATLLQPVEDRQLYVSIRVGVSLDTSHPANVCVPSEALCDPTHHVLGHTARKAVPTVASRLMNPKLRAETPMTKKVFFSQIRSEQLLRSESAGVVFGSFFLRTTTVTTFGDEHATPSFTLFG